MNLCAFKKNAIIIKCSLNINYKHFNTFFYVWPQEVVTNEHVVAMMKAAIRETQDMPMFVSSLFNSYCGILFENGHFDLIYICFLFNVGA